MTKRSAQSRGHARRQRFPYARVRSAPDAALRDYLAIDRTVLSNERTLLSYMRTSLAMVAVGASAIKFFDSLALDVMGWLFIVLGVLVVAYGVRRFGITLTRIRAAVEAVAPPEGDDASS